MSANKWIIGAKQRGMGRESYAVCTEDGNPVDPTLENVAMQAAAPEMYEALKWCINHLERIAERDYPGTTEKIRRFNSTRNAMIAIAHAEGKK